MQRPRDIRGWNENAELRPITRDSMAEAGLSPILKNGWFMIAWAVRSWKFSLCRRGHHRMIRPRSILILALLTSMGCEDPAPTPATPDANRKPVAAETFETAQLYLDAAQFDQAEAIAVAAQREAPDDGTIHELLARIDFGRGMAQRKDGMIDSGNTSLAAALDHWWDACERSPQSGPMHVSAGDVASMLGRHEAARHFYGKALEIDGDGGRAALCLAQLLMIEDPPRARELLRSVTDAGAVAEAHASLALLLARDGDAIAAREQLARPCQLPLKRFPCVSCRLESNVSWVIQHEASKYSAALTTRLPVTKPLLGSVQHVGRRLADIDVPRMPGWCASMPMLTAVTPAPSRYMRQRLGRPLAMPKVRRCGTVRLDCWGSHSRRRHNGGRTQSRDQGRLQAPAR